MGDEVGISPFKDSDASFSGDVLVLNGEDQRAGNDAADVEEAQAALVLLVGLRAAFDDRGLSKMITSLLPGGRTIAAARSIPICGAAIPTPFPKAWALVMR